MCAGPSFLEHAV